MTLPDAVRGIEAFAGRYMVPRPVANHSMETLTVWASRIKFAIAGKLPFEFSQFDTALRNTPSPR